MLQAVWTVLTALLLTQALVLATSIYLHRALAHRALALHPAVDWGFRLLLWLGTGLGRRQWVAVHRKHHAFTDRPGDPHSPRLLGFWRVQLFNVFYYAREARDSALVARFAPDVALDRWERGLFGWGWAGIGAGTGLLMLALGPWLGLATMLLHGFVYVFVLSPLINGLGHWRGRQNFANTAYNSRVLAWITGGESLHNNHHAHPRAPRFSVRRREFDPSWPVIRLLATLRLAVVLGATVRLPGV